MLTFVPIENVAKTLKLNWTLHLLYESHEFMAVIGLIVFAIAFAASIYDSFLKNKDISRINEADSSLYGVTIRGFMISFMLGILLLGIVFVGWVFSFVLPEPLALLSGLIVVSTWLSVTLFRAKRPA